ncbi:MAG: serine hydrolase, partial [Bacteroidales bacterium]|nr:serine hydrolase [Bacteroidales bacterium]
MKRLVSLLLFSALVVAAEGQPLSPKQIDRLTERVLKEFNVPGIAVAVVKDDKVINMKGYGVRSVATGAKTDENTLFAIASNTKAFTVAALGILIDEGKLTWDTKVIDIIPEFRLYNPYVTEDFRIRDLLTHRSGLGLGAGDLMMWPDSAMFTVADIIHNLRHLKQTSPFRTKYDYDNLLYVVAGEVVTRVSGTRWEEFVETRIMQPLGMTGSSASFKGLKEKSNIIDAHVPVNGKLQVAAKQENRLHNSSGGIYSNISDMSKWVIMQMNHGRYGPNLEKQIFTDEVHREMWTPQTIRTVSSDTPYRTSFASYGLGWYLTDINGYLQVYHTGTHSGIVTRMTMLPELRLGIIVLTNQQEEAAHEAITNVIMDSYLGITGNDWVGILKQKMLKDKADAQEITDRVWATVEARRRESYAETDPQTFVGIYSDAWFGDVVIYEESGTLRFRAVKSPKLRGEMFHYTANTFIIKWDDRTMDADAFAVFALDREGKPSAITMEAVSPLTDFSYDFQDLDLRR